MFRQTLSTPYFLKKDRHIDRSLIERAHQLDMQVYYWTIDDQSTMQELIELGADGIFTNRPDLLKEAVSTSRA